MTQFSILLAVNLAALALVFLYVRGKVRKTLEMGGLVEKLREELGELVRDLNQTTDRNITLAEDAIRSLKEATSEVERRASVFKREADRRSAEGAVYDRLGRMREAAGLSNTAGIKPEQELARAPARIPPGENSPEPMQADPAPPIPFVTFSSSPIRPKAPLKEEVLTLNRRGISSDFIAAKLGITVAEVELIVSLEEQRGLLSREDGR